MNVSYYCQVEVSEKEKYEEEVRETIARAFAMSHGVLDTSHESKHEDNAMGGRGGGKGRNG